MQFFHTSNSRNYLSLPHLSFSSSRKKLEFTNHHCKLFFFFFSNNLYFASSINTTHCIIRVSSVILDCLFSNYFPLTWTKTVLSAPLIRWKGKWKVPLFFRSDLKWYSEFLIFQEKYVCSLTTETIGLFVANSILLLFPKCIPYFFPEALCMSPFNSRWSSRLLLYFTYLCQLLHNFSAADM